MQDVAAEMLREARAQLAEQTIAHNLRVLGDVQWADHATYTSKGWVELAHLAEGECA